MGALVPEPEPGPRTCLLYRIMGPIDFPARGAEGASCMSTESSCGLAIDLSETLWAPFWLKFVNLLMRS